jgi:hypothetical protein
MAKCTTTSGSYRCTHEVDSTGKHAGACEAQTREYARPEFVSRHGFWWDVCKTHALTEHDNNGCITCKKSA